MPRSILSLLALLAVVSTTRGEIRVIAVSPNANSVSASRTTSITVVYSAAVDPESVTPLTFSVFGLWSGVMQGTIEVSGNGLSTVFTPDRPFSAGERVTVSLAKSVAGIDGTPMGRGFSWHFMVRTNSATLTPLETDRISVRRRNEGWIQTYGAYAGDFNEDGFTDLTVPNEISGDFRVFLNDGSGGYHDFDIYPVPSGQRPSVNEGADFDMDGHLDYVVGNSTGATVAVFIGDGSGSLEEKAAFPVGLGVRGLAVLDLNGDNYPDVATASRQESVISTLVNNGSGAFHAATIFETPASGETAAAAADLNEDGVMDLLVGAYFSDEMVVLLGDGHGGLAYHDRFPARGSVWMIATGDVNNDGHADVVSANSDDASVSVLLGDGSGTLGPATVYESDIFTIAIDLGDLDGDGDLDMVSSNFGNTTIGSGPGSWIVFENNGAGGFTSRKLYRATGAGSCVVLHDRDNDGTLDITAIDEIEDELILFTNHHVASSTADEVPAASFALTSYPDPFRHSATVQLDLAAPAHVKVEVFDLTGRRIMSTFDGFRPAGVQQIPLGSESHQLPAGTYFLTASVNGRKSTTRIHRVP